MAKVFLRVYNREIESMIETGQLDEAVAHCQHILKTFPMHVDTYRLLGKSFLEARRYTDAADIFQRALMAVPDDFVAHVGMSIIRDDEGKLDDAIWHMQRAFEVQPSNLAIQGELRRLYGRRDGTEPPKIRLSRDALANMYSQGELFNQAIAEIRAVLAEDPNRPDLQIMLARAYFRSGQKVEAAEMSASLLKKYLYCLDALRILVDVLPETARVENTQVYRQRLHMLDPYSSFVSGSTFTSDKVNDGAISLDRLEYRPGAVPVAPQPNWASSLGIKLEEEKHPELPSNRVTPGGLSEPLPIPPTSIKEKATPPPAEEKKVPDWMSAAGWKESSGEEVEKPEDANLQEQPEQAVEGEIPDWLKSMAPKEMSESSIPQDQSSLSSHPPEQSNAPDWLSGLGGVQDNPISEPIQNGGVSQENVFPDWLKDIDHQSSAGLDIAADNALPPQIFIGTGSNQPESIPPSQVPVSPLVSEPKLANDSNPIGAGSSGSNGMEDNAMTWLENLTSVRHDEGDLQAIPEDHKEEIPDWLHSFSEEPVISDEKAPASGTGETAPLDSYNPAVEESDLIKSLPSEQNPVTDAVSDLNLPQELRNEFTIGQEAFTLNEEIPDETSQPKPGGVLEEIPEWLRPVENRPIASEPPEKYPIPLEPVSPEPISIQDQQIEVTSTTLSQNPMDAVATPTIPGIDSTRELESQLPVPGAPQDILIQKPEESLETLPEWIDNISQDSPSVDVVEPNEIGNSIPEEDVTITSWLSKKDVEKALGRIRPTTHAPEKEVTPSEDLPDWLKDLDKPMEREETVKQVEDVPDWLRQPVERPEEEVALKPEVDAGPDMPAWMDDTIPISGPPSPTTSDEWVSAEGKPAPVQDLESIIKPQIPTVETPVQRQILGGTGMLSRVPVEDKDAAFLAAAQKALDGKQLQEAMQAYAKLIKKNRLLDEVIHDLREAIYRFPVDISIWQTLGDAYMRANRLQDALDAYTKAEELLR